MVTEEREKVKGETKMKRLISTLGWLWTVILVGYPLMILAIGSMMPKLHTLVQFGAPPEAVYGGMLTLLAIGGFFIMVEIISAGLIDRPVQMIMNLLASTIWAIGLSWYAGYQMGIGDLEYFEFASAIIANGAVLLGAAGYIIGAFNKNPTQISVGSVGK